jgi:hypothetical protein
MSSEEDMVTWTEYWHAADRWREVVGTDGGRGSFDQFLGGVDHRTKDGIFQRIGHDGNFQVVAPSNVGAARIRMLLGPHYRTIIKAYLARRDNQQVEAR